MTTENEADVQNAQEPAQEAAGAPRARETKKYRVDADGYARRGRGGRKVWVGKTMAGAEVVINDPD